MGGDVGGRARGPVVCPETDVSPAVELLQRLCRRPDGHRVPWVQRGQGQHQRRLRRETHDRGRVQSGQVAVDSSALPRELVVCHAGGRVHACHCPNASGEQPPLHGVAVRARGCAVDLLEQLESVVGQCCNVEHDSSLQKYHCCHRNRRRHGEYPTQPQSACAASLHLA